MWPTTLARDWCGEWRSTAAPFPSEVTGAAPGQSSFSPLETSLGTQGATQEPPLDPVQERELRNASTAQALLVLSQEKRDKLLAEVLTEEELEAPAPPDDFYERVQDYLARQADTES